MRRATKFVALLLVLAIVLLLAAPQLNLAASLTRAHGRALHFITFVIVSLIAALPVLLARGFAAETEPLRRSTPLLDLTCVRLC